LYTQAFLDNGYDDLDICRQIGQPDLDAIGVTTPEDRDGLLAAVTQLQQQTESASDAAVMRSVVTPVYFTLENPDSAQSSKSCSRVSALISERLADDAVTLTHTPYCSQVIRVN